MLIRRITDAAGATQRFEIGLSGVSEGLLKRIGAPKGDNANEYEVRDSGLLVPSHAYALHPHAGTTRGGHTYREEEQVSGLLMDVEAPNLRAGQTAPDDGQFILWYRGSDNSEDRHESVINQDGWVTDYYEQPGASVFLWAHDYAYPAIGRTLELKKAKKFMDFRVQFAVDEWDIAGMPNMAKLVYRLAAGKYMGGCSVGFIGIEEEQLDPERDEWLMMFGMNVRYLKQELLELSACPVGSNRGALARYNSEGLKRAVAEHAVTPVELDASGLGKMVQREVIRLYGDTPVLKAIRDREQAKADAVAAEKREADQVGVPLAVRLFTAPCLYCQSKEHKGMECEKRSGAVLNKKNRERVVQCMSLLEDVLVDAGVDPDTGEPETPPAEGDGEQKAVVLADEPTVVEDEVVQSQFKGIFGDLGSGLLPSLAASKATGGAGDGSNPTSGDSKLTIKLFE